MTIHKLKKHQNQIPYEMISRDIAQSITNPHALAIWIYLLTKSEDWIVRRTHIKQHFGIGDVAYKNAINQLEELGLYEKEFIRGSEGKFADSIIHIYSTPINRVADNPNSDVSIDGEPDNRINHTLKENRLNKENKTVKVIGSSNDKPTSKYPEEFEQIWRIYPKREGSNPKNKAYSACKARLKEGTTWTHLFVGVTNYHNFCQQKGQINTSYVMQASRFFGPELNFENEWTVSKKQTFTDSNSTDWIHEMGDML